MASSPALLGGSSMTVQSTAAPVVSPARETTSETTPSTMRATPKLATFGRLTWMLLGRSPRQW